MNTLRIAKTLIGYRTTSDQQGELDRCLQFIRIYLQQNSDLRFKSFTRNGVQSLLCGFNNISKPDLLLCAHIDVVDGAKEQFIPRISQGKLYGRGAIDMKGPLAVLLSLMKDIKPKGKSISLLVSSDEEVGGINGTGYVLSQIKPKFALIAEESGFDITVQQKGKALLRLSTTGLAGHGSKPDDNNNAIIKLLDTYNSIKPLLKNRVRDESTFNLGVIVGGTVNNTIPNQASLDIDFRFPTRQVFDSTVKQLISKIKNQADLQIVTYSSPMFSGAKSQPYVAALQNLLTSQYQITPQLKKTSYCGDGRYCTDLQIPVIEFGPIGSNYHGDNEYADITSLLTYYKILKDYIYQI